ncbi:hypothetical protein KP509_19G053100 [Ceratopteris richardii]|uniref:G-protein coupled receptors family 3 profile domain-containing protein n=1 Tax=Ceratopteris richardii TaxID=49495 RepID=A0A8T2SKM6_CERRI|nr:hypothetical protein KP509_19G053100 [Ceratopteris richardii]
MEFVLRKESPSTPLLAKDPDDLEHLRPLDKVTVAVIGVGGLLMLTGNIIIWRNRNYRPIKTKSVPLTLLSSAGGLIWIVAALVVNHHFRRNEKSLLANCSLWTFWLQACFGFSLWLNCLTLHLIRLCRIFLCKRGTDNFDYLILLLLLSPAVVFCIVATILKEIRFNKFEGGSDGNCRFEHGIHWALGLIVLLAFYFIVLLYFSFRLRHIMSPFNEFRLIRRGGILSLFLFLLSLVTLSTHAYRKAVGRCLLSFAITSAIFYYFWARNFYVIYNVLFYKDEYLQRFNAEFNRSPSQQDSENRSRSVQKLEELYVELQEEIKASKESIQQLEIEIRLLELNQARTTNN